VEIQAFGKEGGALASKYVPIDENHPPYYLEQIAQLDKKFPSADPYSKTFELSPHPLILCFYR
jgi:hypothetical protein